MSDGPSLSQQVAAVERAAVNWRGHVNNLRDLAERKKRPETEYQMAAAWLPDLDAAAITMHWVIKHEDAILAFVDARRAAVPA